MQIATVKLKRWGNSLAIRIPSRVLKDMSLQGEDQLLLWCMEGDALGAHGSAPAHPGAREQAPTEADRPGLG